MATRKRARQEMEAEAPLAEPSLLYRIRNMWEFAALMQYIFTFGKAVKIDENLGIEDLEEECLKPIHSEKLSEIGLALLKFVSSQRGLTHDQFDKYARRQYQSKALSRNPFGDDEHPKQFAEFDVFTKIRVLWQLSQWTMIHSDALRAKMSEQKDTDQSTWRVEPFGWDSNERTYFLLDDNRLYRRTDAPLPQPAAKPKKNSKKAKAAARAAKRRKTSQENTEDQTGDEDAAITKIDEDDGFGGMKWECTAATLTEYRDFLESICRSKDPNEKDLYRRCLEDILPIVEKAEEAHQRRLAKKQKELLTLEKLANVKRSTRIASKLERQKGEWEFAEQERKLKADMIAARKDQERLLKIEKERETRIMTREQRLKEREMRRALHEEELANLAEDNRKLEQGEGRGSERHLKAEIERRKKALDELAQEKDWTFDCSGCGIHGENLDDGSGIIACERCNVWQHLYCLGLTKDIAAQKDFHFICSLCKRREEDKEKSAKNPIKLDFRKLGSSTSPPSNKHINGDVETSVAKKRKSSEDHSAFSSPRKHRREESSNLLQRSSPTPTNAFSSQHTGGSGLPVSDIGRPLQTPTVPNGRAASPIKKTPPYQCPPTGGLTNGTTSFNDHFDVNGALNGIPHGARSLEALQNGSDPFYNSFSQQRPLSSPFHPPDQPRQSLSPTYDNKDITCLAFPASGDSPRNGMFAPPPQAPGYSPTKQPSPASSSFLHSPSGMLPPIFPPLTGLDRAAATTASPARPVSSGAMSDTTGLPPGPTLSPSPRKLDLTPPSKKLTSPPAQLNVSALGE